VEPIQQRGPDIVQITAPGSQVPGQERTSTVRGSAGTSAVPPQGERILHVTEALAAGVGLSLARLATLQAAAGVRPTVLGLRRYDTPDAVELGRWFGPDVELIVYPRADASRAVQLAWLGAQMIKLLASGRFEVLHLHSSFAGAIGRVLAAPFAARVRAFYSPHGFAFLRSDLGRGQRGLILLAERLLAALPSRLLLVSTSELEVARRVSRKTDLLENGVDLGRFDTSSRHEERERPRVVMVGRVTEQKAPWRFATAAERLHASAEFCWLGYGPDADVARWLGSAPVTVSGRMDHADLLLALRDADLVYFPTLWEGMPLSLIEAQASGLPVVASDIEGNRDVVIDGVTGYLRSTDDDLLEVLAELIARPIDRRRMAVAAAAHSQRFSDAERGRRSFSVYGLRGL
jgi:glycosyltransferase involved in cell wall biosynthesis